MWSHHATDAAIDLVAAATIVLWCLVGPWGDLYTAPDSSIASVRTIASTGLPAIARQQTHHCTPDIWYWLADGPQTHVEHHRLSSVDPASPQQPRGSTAGARASLRD